MSDIKIILKHDVYRDVTVEPINLRNAIYAGDSAAQRIMFRCWANHGSVQPDDLSQKTVTAHFIRPDGGDVVISGVGGAEWSYVDLPEACYVYPGIFKLLIRVSSADPDIVTSVMYIVGRIDKPTTDTIIDPGTTIPSLEDLLALIDECSDATIDAEGAVNYIAQTFDSSENYDAGDYVIHSGELYRFDSAHTGAWTGSDATNVSACNEIKRLDLTVGKAILTSTGNNTKITTGSDLNNITTPGSYYVQNATVAASVSNIPYANSGGRLLVVGTSSNSNYYQMYFPAAGSPYAFIRYTTGSWYTVDLAITRKTDGSDMGTIISNRLTSVKTVKLGPYDYYVSGINMPEGSALIGSGPKTRIILMDSVTTGAAIWMGSRCTVSNLSVVGSLSDIDFDTTGDIESIHIGTRHGIVWLGEATPSDSSANAHLYGAIDDVSISGFTGGGIVCENTGYGTASGINASNCIITNCGAGINVSYWSEYSRFVNINANRNYYGCINNGGNNVFSACSFSGNHVGMYMNGADGKCVRYDGSTATGRNMGHGSAVGCTFNHSGLGADYNTGYAIYFRSIDSGFTFDGCQIFYGKIFGRASAYVMFTNVNFGNDINITIYTPATYMFLMCFFRPNLKVYPYNANTGEKWTTFNSDGNLTRMKFLNCYNSDGTSVTVKSASEATEAADAADNT